jgi:hypothetical protein
MERLIAEVRAGIAEDAEFRARRGLILARLSDLPGVVCLAGTAETIGDSG